MSRPNVGCSCDGLEISVGIRVSESSVYILMIVGKKIYKYNDIRVCVDKFVEIRKKTHYRFAAILELCDWSRILSGNEIDRQGPD